MNQATLEKLKNNPHYKLNAKQKKELEEQARKPMVAFGIPAIHNTNIEKHPTLQRRKR